MQLISLTANKDSFKTVHFKNESGLNLFIGTQKEIKDSTVTKSSTYNGVGKSLIVALIHFCLGSSRKKSLKENIPGWIFTLSFKIGGKEYNSQRSTTDQSKITFNNEEITVTKFNKKLEELLFEIPPDTNYLTFRSLIPFFIRPKKASYVSFFNPNAINNRYQILITNSLLLGLDVLLVKGKYDLRKEYTRIDELVKQLGKDESLKEFFYQKKDPLLEAKQVREDIEKLENDLAQFKVAEDYYEVSLEADRLKLRLDSLNNKKVLLNNQIYNIDKSREITPDIKKENIEAIYKEAKIILKDEVVKTLSELERFYEHLTSSREKRLLDQKVDIQRQIEDVDRKIKTITDDLDDKLRYLDARQALDVFVNLNQKLSDLRTKESKIIRYDELISNYNSLKIANRKKLLESTENTLSYLDDAKEVISETTDFFRGLAKRFYPSSTSGISIVNNDGENQERFKIDAKIDADASDGINNIKIFCYDLTLLLKGFAHNVDFIFHDSRLFSDTDPRQVAESFKLLDEYIKSSGKQYNLTLNQNQLDEIKRYLSVEEYQNIISNNICLELKDEKPEDKLLGIQVNMKYDE